MKRTILYFALLMLAIPLCAQDTTAGESVAVQDSINYEKLLSKYPVILVDGFEVESLDGIDTDDILSVDVTRDENLLKVFYPRTGGAVLIKTKSQKLLKEHLATREKADIELKEYAKKTGSVIIR